MGIGETLYEPWYRRMERENQKAKEEYQARIERQRTCEHRCHVCKAPPGSCGMMVECMKCGKANTILDMAAEYFYELEERISKLEKTLAILEE